jgi:hypothetical protein
LPRTLATHLDADHYWVVYDLGYDMPLSFAVLVPAVAAASGSPAPTPVRDLRLLRCDDTSLFLMVVDLLGDDAAVSVVLIRATANPAAFPCTDMACERLEMDLTCGPREQRIREGKRVILCLDSMLDGGGGLPRQQKWQICCPKLCTMAKM